MDFESLHALLKLLNQIYKSVSMTNNLSWSMNSFPLCRSRVSEMEGSGSLLFNSAARFLGNFLSNVHFPSHWARSPFWNFSRDTLVTGLILIQHFVPLETLIISDKFSPYFNINNFGYIHFTVNHSENFLDPYTGAHTNTIEGFWSQVKRKLKLMIGTSKGTHPSYVDPYLLHSHNLE